MGIQYRTPRLHRCGVPCVALVLATLPWQTAAAQAGPSPAPTEVVAGSPTLEQAQRSFYNGDYDSALVLSEALCGTDHADLSACELTTASLHFKLKKALGDPARDKATAWTLCTVCPQLLSDFRAATVHGQSLARARLATHPDDQDALFFLGKIDLNYVWLHAGTLGRKSGWDEYWEARRSLDRVLRLNPAHVRARVARAWVDYIVGSTVPRVTRWMLGGGNRKRGFLAVRAVAESRSGAYFDQVEAMFAFWDMQIRERDILGAVATARSLARDYPENRELRKFLSARDSTAANVSAPAAP